jgi:hypothetical protein
MSRKWLLFLFCLFVLIALAPLSHASLTLKVNESATRVSFAPQAIEVALVLENSLREPVDQKFLIELIRRAASKPARAEFNPSIEAIKQLTNLLGRS